MENLKIAELIEKLNQYRVINGKKPLKRCKDSRKILIERIKKEKPVIVNSVFTLSKICEELNVNPKIARRKLRNSEETPPTVDGSGWMFLEEHREVITKLIVRR